MDKKPTTVFLDTEFTGLEQDTNIISIGMVASSGQTFYAEYNDYPEEKINEWLQENVIDKLKFAPPPDGEDDHFTATRSEDNPKGNSLYDSYSVELRGDSEQIKAELTRWFAQFGPVEIWADVLAWDWILFCNAFGGAFELPKNIYYIPFDIATIFKLVGLDPDTDREKFAYPQGIPEDADKHNSLWDAKVAQRCHSKAISVGVATQRF